jgi:hypothetical protein
MGDRDADEQAIRGVTLPPGGKESAYCTLSFGTFVVFKPEGTGSVSTWRVKTQADAVHIVTHGGKRFKMEARHETLAQAKNDTVLLLPVWASRAKKRRATTSEEGPSSKKGTAAQQTEALNNAAATPASTPVPAAAPARFSGAVHATPPAHATARFTPTTMAPAAPLPLPSAGAGASGSQAPRQVSEVELERNRADAYHACAQEERKRNASLKQRIAQLEHTEAALRAQLAAQGAQLAALRDETAHKMAHVQAAKRSLERACASPPPAAA